jgi:osmoprotectant transport system permease protein
VAEGDGRMIPIIADFASDFGDAISFIFHSRESVSGGIQVGGLHEIWDLMKTHIAVSAAGLGAACLISIPIGLWLGHIGRGEFAAISVSNVGRAIPTLALLAFFIAYLGLGFVNVAFVLMLLAIPPILTNTYVGVGQVDRDSVDAARGQGMTATQIVTRVELPLAINTIFGGIRISAVNVVATATIAPLADVNTLGRPIINGNVYGLTGQIGGAIVVAVLALAVGQGLALVQRLVTPKGVRLQGSSATRGSRFSKGRLLGGQPT